MNFTALVILLEVDNILAGVFQKKIDKLEINFDYDPDKLEEQFNRAADFIQTRKKLFPIQNVIEKLFLVMITAVLFIVVTFLPIAIMVLYVVFPPQSLNQP